MPKVKINEKYKPLYTSNDDLIIITGGRGSGKSFAIADYACRDTYQIGEKILYTRYTLTSAKTSIIPEYKEKIDLFDAELSFKITEEEITNVITGSSILFKGIKNSSGNQTANLKSIKDPTKWLCDESEEIPDYNTFQKIKRSLRKKGSKIQNILVLNPPSRNHWIYKKFFEPNNIPDGFNGSVNGITYIHTTYLDNLENLDESFIKDAERTKRENPAEYRHVFLGYFEDDGQDDLFTRESIINLFNNTHVLDGKKYITADIALQGADKFVLGVWSGLKLIDVSIIDKLNGKELVEILTNFKNKYAVPNSQICYDNDGLGSYLGGFFQGAVEFKNNGRVIGRRNYRNLKTQCFYEMAEVCNNNEVYITDFVANKIFSGKKFRQMFENEIKAARRAFPDSDGKLSIIKKEDMKSIIGHSPDILDMFIMRIYFNLRPPQQTA